MIGALVEGRRSRGVSALDIFAVEVEVKGFWEEKMGDIEMGDRRGFYEESNTAGSGRSLQMDAGGGW